jgi:hypothetical protein
MTLFRTLVPSPETSHLWSTCRACVLQRLVFVLAFAVVFAAPRRSAAQIRVDTNKPVTSANWESLPPTARARVSWAIGSAQRRYYFVRQQGGFAATAGHGLSAQFTKRGAIFEVEGSKWGLAVRRYGYGTRQRRAVPTEPHAQRNQIEYRQPLLTEWYVNGPVGLEQGFTLADRPGDSRNELLTLQLAVSGGMDTRIDGDKRGLTISRNGRPLLLYGGLTVDDVKGRELPAWLELSGKQVLLRINDSEAQYPLTIDPIVQAAKLTISGEITGDNLGSGVAVSGDGNTVVVGAVGEDFGSISPYDDIGAAYIFVKPSGGWADTSTYTAKLTASDAGPNYHFGFATSISGDGKTVVVAAIQQGEQPGTLYPGQAYVFVKPTNGWVDSTETAALSASDKAGTLGFCLCANNVAISYDGNTIAQGVPFEKVGSNDDQGAAYVFVKPTGGWTTETETAKLTASDGAALDAFGFSVGTSSDGSTIVVSAADATVGSNAYQGAAYVFKEPAGGWATTTQTAKLTASDGATNNLLGYAARISGNGDTVVLGAPWAKIGSNILQGAEYVFAKSSGGWANATQTAKLTESDGAANDWFGQSVSISNDGSAIAGFGAHPYVFYKPAAGWADATEDVELSPKDAFGAVSLSAGGDTILVGTPSATIGSNVNQGAAYVFTGSTRTPKASLSTTTLQFGNQAVGTTSGTQQVTITNSGNGPLHVTSIAASANFTSTQTCVTASPVAPGSSCSEDVAFAPGSGAIGTDKGTLTLTDDDGGTSGSTQTVSLSGTGVQASTSLSLSASPGTAMVSFPETISFTVNPQAGDTLTPSGSVTLSAAGQSCTKSAPSGSCSFTFVSTGTVTVSGNYGSDTNFTGSSGSLDVPVTVTAGGITNIVNEELGLGCIDSQGVAGALNTKLATAQADITAGKIQQAINTLTALLNQLRAQQGKHIKTTCTDSNGNTLDLIALVKAVLASLGVTINADPILGNILNKSGMGLTGMIVNVLNPKNVAVISTTTDITGFYYFAATQGLVPGTNYTVKVAVPKTYKSSTPSSQGFTWRSAAVALNNFVLN